uniref:Uncharacterized protein n=1 Tax=Avena sativa TaxID=4498 RepID=A0ACD6AFW7_AVESA
MPSSKRPSPLAAMDDDDAAGADGLRVSPPRSKKRSSRPKSGRRSPNPNPRPRGDYYGSEPSRKSERKRKPRSFPDSAVLPKAIVARPASPYRGGGGGGSSSLLWTDGDEVALLTGAVAFRAGSGRAPRLPDTGPLFESIRDSLSPHIDQAKVYYKLKRLKSKFCNTALPPTSTPHERRVRDLSADLWGPDLAPPVEDAMEAEEEEEEDPDEGYIGAHVAVGVRLPLVSDLLGEYWRRNAGALSGVSLEKGLALLGADEGRVAETKWRQQLDAEMRTQVRRHDLAKEVFGLLIDTIKGLGP